MRWVAIFDEVTGMREVRAVHERAHVEYLRNHQDEILLAGGLRDGLDAPFGGGLWILAPMDRERAVELVEKDPYFLASKRSFRLFQWGKALPDLKVTL